MLMFPAERRFRHRRSLLSQYRISQNGLFLACDPSEAPWGATDRVAAPGAVGLTEDGEGDQGGPRQLSRTLRRSMIGDSAARPR